MALIGTIMIWTADWAPIGWEFCHGQEKKIKDNSGLYAVLQNTYGSEGDATVDDHGDLVFRLPDFRGRVPLCVGQADGLSNYSLGKKGGTEKVSLSASEMPPHNHNTKIQVASPIERGTQTNEVANNYLANGNTYASKANNSMAADVISMSETGEGNAHENRQPYIAINYIICVAGEWPYRKQ